MKRFLIASALFAIAAAASAGLTYKVQSTTAGARPMTMAGTVNVEGSSMRFDVASGDGMLFKDNSIVLSSDGGKTMSIFDPSTHNYYDLHLDQLLSSTTSMLSSLGGMVKVSFKDPHVEVRDGGDGGTIEGYATHKYILDASYDVDIDAMGQKMLIHAKMTTENWTTDQLSGEFASFIQTRGMRTGIDAVDRLIEAQGNAARGFPLKQVSTVRMNDVTITTSSSVTDIQRRAIGASQFATPSGYTKVDDPITKMMRQMTPPAQ
jgi:hypothetical protein